jgi:hypothetical protein
LTFQVDRYHFFALAPSQGCKVVDKKLFSFLVLTPSIKPLGLISGIAPIGMLDLSSSLARLDLYLNGGNKGLVLWWPLFS